jgi:hypothetical protein
MFRSVSLAALLISLAIDVSSATGVAAHSGTDTSVAAGASVMLSPMIERRTISEPSVLLLMGLALLTASRAARR